jgi:hypothetical protein
MVADDVGVGARLGFSSVSFFVSHATLTSFIPPLDLRIDLLTKCCLGSAAQNFIDEFFFLIAFSVFIQIPPLSFCLDHLTFFFSPVCVLSKNPLSSLFPFCCCFSLVTTLYCRLIFAPPLVLSFAILILSKFAAISNFI